MRSRKKRPRGRGQIVERGPERYLVRVYIGRDRANRRRYSSRTVRGTYGAAQRALTKALREVDAGTFVEPCRQTLAEYLERWLETVAKLSVADRTLEDYRARLRRDVVPTLGHRRLDQLSVQDVQALYAEMSTRGLGPRTIRYTHSVLRQALEKAVQTSLLARNPTQYAELPRQVRAEMRALTPQQVTRFLAATASDPWYPLWAVLLLGGLRPGEALGLKWADVQERRLRIVRALKKGAGNQYMLAEPKTERSRRGVMLPQQALDALQSHRASQAAVMLRTGAKYARQDLVFANARGGLLDVAKVRRHFKKALAAAGLPSVRLYDTRHTHATLLLAAGENPKVVSERLGHTNIGITLDTYSHVLPDMQENSVQRLEATLRTFAAG